MKPVQRRDFDGKAIQNVAAEALFLYVTLFTGRHIVHLGVKLACEFVLQAIENGRKIISRFYQATPRKGMSSHGCGA